MLYGREGIERLRGTVLSKETGMNSGGTDGEHLSRGVPGCFRFDFRVYFLAVLVACAAMSWIAVMIWQAERRRNAVEAFQKLGGIPIYAWELRGETRPPGPEWLQRLFGVDFVDSVVKLNLSHSRVTDADLEHLTDLRGLISLRLDGTQVTDDGLRHLTGLEQLSSLWLNRTGITDAGLEHLEDLETLQTLLLAETQISDAGLRHLHRLSRLEVLVVAASSVTSEGAAKLRHVLKNCKISR